MLILLCRTNYPALCFRTYDKGYQVCQAAFLRMFSNKLKTVQNDHVHACTKKG